MLKKFFSNVLSSFVGAWLALVVFSVAAFFMGFAVLASFDTVGGESETLMPKSILHLNLAGTFEERANDDDMWAELLEKEGEKTSTLDKTLKALELAKNNDNIEGVFVDCKICNAGTATLYELREALADFKNSGKFVVAYGHEGITQGDYYIASVADSIFLNPVGSVDIHGLTVSIPFFKNLLDKVGVEMQIVRVGTFKSAVEPYIATEASEANVMATSAYLNSIWGNMSESMAESRGMTVEKFNAIADEFLITQPVEYLLENNIVDALAYRFEVLDKLKEMVSADELRLVSPEQVAASEVPSLAVSKIAVIYAVGQIDGSAEDGVVSSVLVKDIMNVVEDESVAGVVLRVNSPGGSAFGSEQIWAALEEVKKAGKPFAVSMGDLAASGGYYISCGADKIFAEPTTITGSIGIFGTIPCIKELLNDKVGVNITTITTNNPNNTISLTEPMTPIQQAAMQRMVNQGYELFTSRCANGRGMDIDSLKMIAEGRVWDGITAKKLGLVDEFGNLQDAIDWVVEEGKVAEYSIVTYPKQKTMLERYMSTYMGMKVSDVIANKAGEVYKYHKELHNILSRDHLQCLMEPVEIK